MKRENVLRLILAALLMAVIGTAYHLLPLNAWGSALLEWIRGFGLPGAAIYGAVYAVGVLFFPASLLTAGAGLVYGPLVGVVIISPASVIGALLAFLVTRYFAGRWVESKVASQPKFAAMQRAVEKNGFKFVLLLRLQPILPFVFLNYALGLTRVRLRDYVLASWIGMLPGTILYVYLGAALGNVDDLFRPGALQHGNWTSLLFWAGLAAAALLAVWAGRLGRAALREELEQQPETPRSVA
ncbi:MAG TPA: TVP38/TMEM64 family protein [Candidatus Limnocylindrales bacterium]|nr:TVP38/TMEM64 family protein [Candidatus Limnocylindrales bacterium]